MTASSASRAGKAWARRSASRCRRGPIPRGETTMLHEFLSANRDELIRRCRTKVSKRAAPPVTALELEHGVPLFLEQLVEALRCEQGQPLNHDGVLDSRRSTAASIENSRTAALHGKELL